MPQLPLITIVGPTASGKTRRAVSLAIATGAEIISGDSRQVYRGMDLGTGKDLDDYAPLFGKYDGLSGSAYPGLHLIDVCAAGDKYNLHQYLRDYDAAESLIRSRGNNVLLCGGTGMYVEAVLSGLKLPEVPEDAEFRRELQSRSLAELHEELSRLKKLHNTTDVDTHARAVRALEIERYYAAHPEAAAMADRSVAKPRKSVIFLIDIPRDERRKRITSRLKERLNAGMTSEVEALLREGVSADNLIYYGLEYKYVTLHVLGKITKEEMFKSLETAIHQFAKRQMTWWRGMERRGFRLHPIPYDLSDSDFLAATLPIIERQGF